MCKYCKEGAFNTIIENSITEWGYCCWGVKGLYDEPVEADMSVVFEVRNGRGYIRLGDRKDMNCLDQDNKKEVSLCIICGRKLGERT